MTTKTFYVLDIGSTFSEKFFHTLEEAIAEKMKLIQGVDIHDNYKKYWHGIGNKARIYKLIEQREEIK